MANTKRLTDSIIDWTKFISSAEKKGVEHAKIMGKFWGYKDPYFPHAIEEPFHYPITCGGTLTPHLIMLKRNEFEYANRDGFYHIKHITDLDFYDEYVSFFGSFDHFAHHTLTSTLKLGEYEEYDLPEYFLNEMRSVYRDYNPERSLSMVLMFGNYSATVVAVFNEDKSVSLYKIAA